MVTLPTLLRAAAAGYPGAVGELVRQCTGPALRLARSLLPNASLAEDVVQEAFLVALRRLPSLRQPEAFAAWFRQIVRTSADRVVRRRREASLPDGEEPTDTAASPPDRAAQSELARAVRRALAGLPPAERASAELFYLRERTVAEVAQVLDVPPGTVRRRLFDARARLATLLIGNPGAWRALSRENES